MTGHGNLTWQPIKIQNSMAVTIDSEVSGERRIFFFKGGVLHLDAGRDAAPALRMSLSGGGVTATLPPLPPPPQKKKVT